MGLPKRGKSRASEIMGDVSKSDRTLAAHTINSIDISKSC